MEYLVFALLERVRPGNWEKYRGLFQALRFRYPIVVVNRKHRGRAKRKIVVFLKRHEDLWLKMYEILGWKLVERCEMGLSEFKAMYEGFKRLLEAMREFDSLFSSLPNWLCESLRPVVALGELSVDKALAFLDSIEKTFREYMETPKALINAKNAKTRFQRLIRTSTIAALAIRGTDRRALRREVASIIEAILSKGVVPVDYSYNYIIVARKRLVVRGRRRNWLSALGYDPIDVLRGLEARPARVLLSHEKIEIVFEERDIGWGLSVIEKT